MEFRLVVLKPWRYRDHSRGLQHVKPGSYDVPEQISCAAAALALGQGIARREDPPRAPVAVDRSPVPPAPRGRARRKGPAPENKIVHAAEDKSTLV